MEILRAISGGHILHDQQVGRIGSTDQGEPTLLPVAYRHRHDRDLFPLLRGHQAPMWCGSRRKELT